MSEKKSKESKETKETKKEKRVQRTPVDEATKTKATNFIKSLVDHSTFPKFSEETVGKLAKDNGYNEKSIGAFLKRLEKFYGSITRGKKVKKAKEIEAALEAKIKESLVPTAQSLAKKMFNTTVAFSKFLVTKKNEKKGFARGKVFFNAANGKTYFMYWDYRDEVIFGSVTLHEPTKED